ncbi:MAG: sigma-70 family RNA polymerase sigma factor [Planctomycetota bacterium]
MRAERREREAHRAFCGYRNTGDPKAATRVFDLTEPLLLVFAGHLVRDRATAEDAVQWTFVAALEDAGSFDPARPVIPWLTGILLKRIQHERRRSRRQIDPSRLEPRRAPVTPDAAAEAQEYAELLLAALERLPESYRDVLRLKLLQGWGPSEIATELARPRETVKTQLTRGLALLRRDLPARGAPVLAALLANAAGANAAGGAAVGVPARSLVPPPQANGHGGGATAAAPPSVGDGGVTHGWRWLWVGAGALGVTLGLWTWGRSGPDLVAEDRAGAAAPATATASPPAMRERAAPGANERGDGRRSPVDGASRWTVAVRWHDGAPAVDVEVAARPAGDEVWVRERRVRTNGRGEAEFVLAAATADAAAATRWRVRTDRGEAPRVIDLAQRARLEVALPAGVVVAGSARDATGAPVAGARVCLAAPGARSGEAMTAAITTADGRFHLRDVLPGSAVGAFAAGLGGPRCVAIGTTGHADLTLPFFREVTRLRGMVRDAQGEPVANAHVLVGWSALAAWELQLPLPSRTRTDAAGVFLCDEQWGEAELPVWVAAPGLAVGQLVTPRLSAGMEHAVDVVLRAGAAVRGRILRADGRAAARVRVEIRQATLEPPTGFEFIGASFGRCVTITDANGRFEVEGLRPGNSEMRVRAGSTADVIAGRRELSPGRHEWDVVLPATAPLRARLLDPDGRPLSGWVVRIRRPDDELVAELATGAEGRVRLDGCAVGDRFKLFCFQPDAVLGDAGSGPEVEIRPDHEHTVRVPHVGIASAFVACTLRRPTGVPLADVRLKVERIDDAGVIYAEQWTGAAADGVYRVGPLLPGRYRVAAAAAGLGIVDLGRVELASAGEADLGEHAFAEPGELKVRVLDATGAPLQAETLPLMLEGGEVQTGLRVQAGAGTAMVQPGVYTLSYMGGAGAALAEVIRVGPGEQLQRDLVLTAGVVRQTKVSGITRDYTHLRLRWFRDEQLVADEPRTLMTHVGPWTVQLEPGSYRVETRDLLGRVATTRFTVTAEPSDDVMLLRSPR